MADIIAADIPLSPQDAGPPLSAAIDGRNPPQANLAETVVSEAEVSPDPADPAIAAAQTDPVQPEAVLADAPEAEDITAEAPKEPKGVGKKLAAMQAQIDAAEAEAAKLRDEVQRYQAQPKEPDAPARPRRESFDNPDAYDEALVEWTATVTAQRVAHENVKAAQEARQAAFNEAQTKAWTAKVAVIEEKYPDYKTVIARDDVRVSPVMTEAIRESDNGPDIVYHLGKNPEEAARILNLSPMKQVFEINKISARLTEADKPQASRAPKPIPPIGARTSATKRTAETAQSMEEFAAIRAAEREAKRAGQPQNGIWQRRQ